METLKSASFERIKNFKPIEGRVYYKFYSRFQLLQLIAHLPEKADGIVIAIGQGLDTDSIEENKNYVLPELLPYNGFHEGDPIIIRDENKIKNIKKIGFWEFKIDDDNIFSTDQENPFGGGGGGNTIKSAPVE